jgi:RNA polymerase sigma-70 factor (ECF subfamily)
MNQSEQDFQNLYNQYHIMVYNMVLHYLQNTQEAEEITQDVFVQVYHSLEQFNQKSSLKTWIYRIALNKCHDLIKHKNSRKRWFIFGAKSQNEHDYLNHSNFEHPGILLENKEKAALLYQTINTLPENQKTAFVLSKIEGLSNPEIAEVMNLSVSAIESLVFRAKASLQEKLSEKFIEYRKKK